jgi:hypothetical protein
VHNKYAIPLHFRSIAKPHLSILKPFPATSPRAIAMQLSTLLPILSLGLLAVQVSADGPPNSCSFYHDCKCHDSANHLQNDAATKAACAVIHSQYSETNYNDAPHHQCHSSNPMVSWIVFPFLSKRLASASRRSNMRGRS